MDHNDRQAIEDLFGKLADVERQAAPRDGEAEAFIRDRIAAQPAAPYFMAQTIVVQEQALNAAQQRIEELEYQVANRPAGGGYLSGLFGSASAGRPAAPPPSHATASGPWSRQSAGLGQGSRGSGFLAGAAQTAMGVAGGVLLGNAITGMLGGSEANAAEKSEPEEQEDGGATGDFGDSEL
ncbi:DUF2076 domain-containing protein [Sinorhizobium meliloti]|uniref:DUF2076 domain-containing protein n=1 Tax=Rhizobium meliloti TaxID=382 RepID=UPI000FD8308B|nr:DUF2076 domain-containing protein [Sinorhizobium meliloti]RVH29282.1 DUF2076 domain-containing protein [Sinorhizobium meliloti]